MNELVQSKGVVIFDVFDEYMKLKQRSVSHNIMTNQGDSYIADLLSNTPARVKFSSGNGYIAVGTGWTGVSPKANTWVNTIVGTPAAITNGYPQLQATWGLAGSNILITLCTYAVGSLNVVGINEAALVTAATQGAATSCLAYAQVVPSTNVTSSDTLQITWQITFLGS